MQKDFFLTLYWEFHLHLIGSWDYNAAISALQLFKIRADAGLF